MTTAQLHLQQQAKAPLRFLDDIYSDCILGWAERRDNDKRVVYCYHKSIALQNARQKDVLEALRQINKDLFSGDPESPLISMRIHRPAFWPRIKRQEFPVWEHLTPAIHSVVCTTLAGDWMVLYDYVEVVKCLMSITEDSSRNPGEYDNVLAADAYFKEKILVAQLGDRTPFYLHKL